jgi:hypothetical protein
MLITANMACEVFCYERFLTYLYNLLAIKHTCEEQITAVPLQHLP